MGIITRLTRLSDQGQRQKHLFSKIIKLHLILVFCCYCIPSFSQQSSINTKQPPNIIFILADDLGYGDLQCYGNPYVETPNINRLAAEGVRCTDYYSPSPLCAPARAGILTGKYNHRTGAVDVSSNRGIDRISLSEKTIGNYFQNIGYKTGLIGKWHNGLYSLPYLPHKRGFDLFYGFPNGGQDYYEWNMMRNGVYEQSDGRYSTHALSEEAVKFIRDCNSIPFLLFLSHHAPHSPFQAPDTLIHKYQERLTARYPKEVATIYAMIEAMDQGVGDILDVLDSMKLRSNTIIVFTSDNGAAYIDRKNPRYQGPFVGMKGNVLEQGIRVPAIISWIGKIPEGKISNVPMHGCDWIPTFLDFASAYKRMDDPDFDGMSLANFFQHGDTARLKGRPFFFQKNRYTPVMHSEAAIRKGQWKLYWPGIESTMKKQMVRDNPSYQKGITDPHWEMPIDHKIPAHTEARSSKPRLYNLDNDPSERYDVSIQHPVLVQTMKSQYDNWFSTVMRDWNEAWSEIKTQDARYWSGKEIPNPLEIYSGYWEWERAGIDSSGSDPLRVFQGYW